MGTKYFLPHHLSPGPSSQLCSKLEVTEIIQVRENNVNRREDVNLSKSERVELVNLM